MLRTAHLHGRGPPTQPAEPAESTLTHIHTWTRHDTTQKQCSGGSVRVKQSRVPRQTNGGRGLVAGEKSARCYVWYTVHRSRAQRHGAPAERGGGVREEEGGVRQCNQKPQSTAQRRSPMKMAGPNQSRPGVALCVCVVGGKGNGGPIQVEKRQIKSARTRVGSPRDLLAPRLVNCGTKRRKRRALAIPGKLCRARAAGQGP